ncbi:DUF6449 domain-containing protein [Schaedlerella arabinosiphila]|uniref:DUF6449 domain-containing protein n=1 Tax=Schaedlerella arabinosiphila TaxID=2044587 RepID=UPI002557F7E8|nr:DUF6449 domain-containing protein [Schaedlerella arabinosiphila]
MTSKISYSKFIKEDIRRRGWLLVLSAVLLLLCVTVSTLLMLEASLSNVSQDELAEQWNIFRAIFPGLLNGSYNLLLFAALLLLGGLCAVTGFSYLHSREQTDFYHSLPLSRRQLFFISYLGGLLIFLVPYLAASLLAVLAGFAHGFFTLPVLGRCFLSVLGGTLAFLMVYHLMILAMMLTGKVVTGILAAASLFFYGSVIGVLAADLPTYFFSTYHTGAGRFWEKLYDFLSPLPLFGQILGNTAYYNVTEDDRYRYISTFSYYLRSLVRPANSHSLAVVLAAAAVFLAVLLLLALFLYQKRPSEAAGNALSFPITAPFIKVLISVPTALCIGILVGSMYSGSTKWIILMSILAVILLCGLIEFIYHMDVRRLFAGKYSSLASLLGVAGILCVLQFDVFGYDTWLPEEDSLESMSLDISQMYGYFSYPDTVSRSTDHPQYPDLLNGEICQIQEFAPIYELARSGVENAGKGADKMAGQELESLDSSINAGTRETEMASRESESLDEQVYITVRYNKKSGSSVYRNYRVSAGEVLDTLDILCQEESYRKILFPVFYADYEDISAVRLTDIYWEPKILDLTEKEQDALLDAYKQDVLNVDIRDLQLEQPIGELSIDIPEGMQFVGQMAYDSKYNFTLGGFYLYEGYENSLALLETYGYTLRREIDPEDVEQVKLAETIYTEEAPAEGKFSVPDTSERIVTDSDEIAAVLSQVQYTTSRLLISTHAYGTSAEILLTGNKEPTYYTLTDEVRPSQRDMN